MLAPPLSAVLGIGFIAAVLTVMLYPMAGTERYFWYKHPLFIAGVVFMPMFAFVAANLQSSLPVETKTWLLLVGMGLFWASALILIHPAVHGSFVADLKFRPDFILPGGVNFVKGVVLTGIGLMLTFQDPFKLPQWNWWGFVLAFWGIILIIPVRGMLKMHLRMHRLVGLPWGKSWGGLVLREGVLFLGLLILLYGFLNAFMGAMPFTTVVSKVWSGWLLVLLSALLLAARGLYKRTLPEGAETWSQTLVKQLWLYAAVLPMLYGYVVSFMGRWMTMHPATNPQGFALGLLFVALGFVLAVPVRVVALRHEWEATVRNVMGMLSMLPADRRWTMMRRRMQTLLAAPEKERRGHLRAMAVGLSELTDDQRQVVMETMVTLLAAFDDATRMIILSSNAAALQNLPEVRRQAVMGGMIGAVAQLPSAQRRQMMQSMDMAFSAA